MANDNRTERKRFGHYVPIEIVQLFDSAAEIYPQFTKQGFFEIVIIAGLNSINSDDFEWGRLGQALSVHSKEVEGFDDGE